MLKRKIIFLNILVFSAVSGISAQTDSTAVKPVLEKKNVMEYKLQSWPKIEKLESTRFSDHMFMSLGVGMEGFTNRQIVNSASTTGVNGAVSVGKWFNAISGARLGISVSSRGSGYENTGNQMIMGLTADYMLDFTSLIPMKYHYDRIFNFSLYTGFGGYFTTFDKTTSIDGQSPVTESVSKVVPGFRLGVNAGFKLNQATTLFFEPGITAYGKGIDPNNGDPLANSWRGFAIAPSFRAGISYRVIPVAYRKGVTDFLSAGFFDNTFITYAAGVEALVAGGDYDAALSDNMGGKAQFGIGKWFTASSGARLLANAGYVDWMVNGNNVGLDAKQSKKLAHIGFQADYLLNLSALFGGYQPDSRGGLLLIGGLNVNKSEKTALTGWSYGAGVGMQIYTRLMGNTDIFLEPRANFNTTKYAAGYSSSSYDITPSVMVGLTHYPRVDITRRKDTYDNAFYQGWEYSLGWGFGTPVTIATKSNLGKTMEPHLNANIAKWYNAYSGLRLDGRLGVMGSTENEHRTKFGTLGLFYQLKGTNAMMGYKNYSKTELVASVGPEIMYNSHSKNNPANLSMGASAGLKGIYNVCREFGIYIEPRIGIYQNKAFSSKSPFGKFDNAAFITAGVMYKPFIDEYSVEKMTRNSYNNWFIAAGAGINAPLNSLTIKEPFGDIINPIGNFYLGKWFTGVSGARLQLYGGSLAEVGPRVGNDIKTSTMIGAGLHYMVNFTNLTRGYKGVNRTEVIVTAGPEVLYNSKTSNSPSSIAYGFAGSVQGIWNVTDQLGLYLEPKLGVYSNKLVNGKLAKFEVDGLGSRSAGVIDNTFVRERRDGEMKPRGKEKWL